MNGKIALSQLKELKRITRNVKKRLAAEWRDPWKVLIAVILSAQNKDSKTIEICEKHLFKKYPKPEKLGNARLSSIEKIIRPINYYKTKARHIKKTAKIISKKGIPNNLEELMKLPGVGRKTANVYLAQVHKAQAIGVDTHVARISRKLGWTKSTNPKKIEEDLVNLFPKRYWNSINYILVRFGQNTKRKDEDKILENIKNKIY